jgi:hypothetical protein
MTTILLLLGIVCLVLAAVAAWASMDYRHKQPEPRWLFITFGATLAGGTMLVVAAVITALVGLLR